MANFVDALLGYEYYIENRAKVSFEEINNYLELKKRNPIAQRTFDHYRSLWRYGFKAYFPINQFDVSRTLGRLPIAPDRRQYDRQEVSIDAEFSSDGTTWTSVKIMNKSPVSFGICADNKLIFNLKDVIFIRMENFREIPVRVI